MDQAKIRMRSTMEEVWRLGDPGFKVYVAEAKYTRWAHVMTEFDEVQQEMREEIAYEYNGDL